MAQPPLDIPTAPAWAPTSCDHTPQCKHEACCAQHTACSAIGNATFLLVNVGHVDTYAWLFLDDVRRSLNALTCCPGPQ